MPTDNGSAETLTAKELLDEQSIDLAIQRFVDIMGDRPKGTISPKRLDRSARHPQSLLAAMTTIGQALGVTPRITPQLNADQPFEEQIAHVAKQLGLEARMVTLSGSWWKTNHGPLLVSTDDDRILAALPKAWGGYRFNQRTCYSKIDGTAYAFYRTLDEQPIGLRQLFGVLSSAENKQDLLYVLALGAVSSLMALAIPFFMGIVVDRAIPESDRGLLFALGLGMGAVTIGAANFNLFRSIIFNRLNSRFDLVVPASLIERLVRLPVAFFRKFSSGDLADRVFGVTDVVKSSTNDSFESVASFIFAFFYLFLILFYSPLLGAISLLGALVIVLVQLGGSVMIYNLQKLSAEENGKLNGLVVQMLRGIDKLRVAKAEKRAFAKWSDRYAWIRKRQLKSAMISNGLNVFSSFASLLLTAALFAVFSLIVAKEGADRLSVGDFMVISTAFGSFQSAMTGAFSALSSILPSIPVLKRAKPMLDSETEKAASMAETKISGKIELNQVTFQYEGSSIPAVCDFSLQISPGEFIAVVGPSGSGKSTLAKLLLGFLSPESGSIFYDDRELRSLHLRSVRQQVGTVLQEGELLHNSIWQNIVGTSNKTIEEAWEAARLVSLAEDINAMPMKMHTVISEGAKTISGGQRQRILLARALISEPRILILDEATSALDNQTQAEIQANLEQLTITRIVIAHRLSTVANADRVVVLQRGRIVQLGHPKDVMKSEGFFKDSMSRQHA